MSRAPAHKVTEGAMETERTAQDISGDLLTRAAKAIDESHELIETARRLHRKLQAAKETAAERTFMERAMSARRLEPG